MSPISRNYASAFLAIGFFAIATSIWFFFEGDKFRSLLLAINGIASLSYALWRVTAHGVDE